MKKLFVFLFLTAALSACNGDDGVELPSVEDQLERYIEDNSLTGVQTTREGLRYIILEQGNGITPTLQDDVEVSYVGELFDGTVFDQTAPGQTVTFALSRLIPAWQIGLPLIGEGGRILLICPPELGYGSRGAGTIPPNAVLGFELELFSVTQ